MPSLTTEERETLEKLRYSNDVELTEEEKHDAITRAIEEAKRTKAASIREKLHWKRVNSPVIFQEYNAKQFTEVVTRLGEAISVERNWPRPFTTDEHNQDIFAALALYFTGDRRFENAGDGFSLNKGIMLAGDVGCGKTVLMQLFRVNPIGCYTQHDCIEIAQEYQEEGPKVIGKYAENYKAPDKRATFNQEWIGRFFDDLGAEGTAKNYGNEKNVMAEIIMQRYKIHPHNMTHFTSNHTIEGLQDAYGARVADRLREMCNIMMFPAAAKSRRR